MQIWQLFIILKLPVHISVTVFYNLTKLTYDEKDVGDARLLKHGYLIYVKSLII